MISMSKEIPCSNALQYKCPFQYAVLQCGWALHSIRPCTLHSIQNSNTSTSSLLRKFFYSFLKYIHPTYAEAYAAVGLPWRQSIQLNTPA